MIHPPWRSCWRWWTIRSWSSMRFSRSWSLTFSLCPSLLNHSFTFKLEAQLNPRPFFKGPLQSWHWLQDDMRAAILTLVRRRCNNSNHWTVTLVIRWGREAIMFSTHSLFSTLRCWQCCLACCWSSSCFTFTYFKEDNSGIWSWTQNSQTPFRDHWPVDDTDIIQQQHISRLWLVYD